MLTFYLALLSDEAAKNKFEQLYLQYRHTLYWVALQILNDSSLAEDAVHDAFLRILNHLENISLEKCNKTRTFVVIIVRSIAIDMLRKKKKLAETDLEEQYALSAGEQSDPEMVLLEKENNITIKKALKKMKQSYTDILTLQVVYGKSNQEIAKMLNLSPENVRIRLFRARQRLLSLLKEVDGLDG